MCSPLLAYASMTADRQLPPVSAGQVQSSFLSTNAGRPGDVGDTGAFACTLMVSKCCRRKHAMTTFTSSTAPPAVRTAATCSNADAFDESPHLAPVTAMNDASHARHTAAQPSERCAHQACHHINAHARKMHIQQAGNSPGQSCSRRERRGRRHTSAPGGRSVRPWARRQAAPAARPSA